MSVCRFWEYTFYDCLKMKPRETSWGLSASHFRQSAVLLEQSIEESKVVQADPNQPSLKPPYIDQQTHSAPAIPIHPAPCGLSCGAFSRYFSTKSYRNPVTKGKPSQPTHRMADRQTNESMGPGGCGRAWGAVGHAKASFSVRLNLLQVVR